MIRPFGTVTCALGIATSLMTQVDDRSDDYLPLRVGNTWSFTVNAVGIERREAIESIESIEGHTYYRFSSFAGNADRLVRVDADNRLLERIDDHDIVRYAFGAAVGTKWAYPGGTMVIEGREETVTVPAGTFTRCVKFHFYFQGRDGDWEEWYAPGVGPVKRIQFGYAVVEYQLESVHLNSAK